MNNRVLVYTKNLDLNIKIRFFKNLNNYACSRYKHGDSDSRNLLKQP